MNHLCRRGLLVISALLVVVIALSAETSSTAQDPLVHFTASLRPRFLGVD